MHGAKLLPSGGSVTRAVSKGTAFLTARRTADGWWDDYEVRGPGRFWVTAFAGASLADVPAAAARSAAATAWELLTRARVPSDGWGYGPGVPGDADITSWALRLAEALGAADHPRAVRGYDFVRGHLREDGGIASYLPEIAGPFLRRVAPRWDGWYQSHACVTAAAGGLLRLPCRDRVLTRLHTIQHPDGSWPAYWWADREYSTALAAEALMADRRSSAHHRDQPAAALAGSWAAERIGADGAVRTAREPDGSPFATAFAVRAAVAGAVCGTGPAVRRAVRWLLDAQLATGGWKPSAWCRVPDPLDMDPDTRTHWACGRRGRTALGSVVLDTGGRYTTASVVAALAQVEAAPSACAPGVFDSGDPAQT